MNDTLTLDLISIDDLFISEIDTILGGAMNPIITEFKPIGGITTAVWFDTGIRP